MGNGLINACVRSTAAYVTASYEGVLENRRVSGKKSAVLDTRSLSVLGM